MPFIAQTFKIRNIRAKFCKNGVLRPPGNLCHPALGQPWTHLERTWVGLLQNFDGVTEFGHLLGSSEKKYLKKVFLIVLIQTFLDETGFLCVWRIHLLQSLLVVHGLPVVQYNLYLQCNTLFICDVYTKHSSLFTCNGTLYFPQGWTSPKCYQSWSLSFVALNYFSELEQKL